MEALPSLKVEKEASGEAVVKDIQRVRQAIYLVDNVILKVLAPLRTKTSSTMRSSSSYLAASSLFPRTRLARGRPSTIRTRLSERGPWSSGSFRSRSFDVFAQDKSA